MCIRFVAGKYFMNFEIPTEFRHLWRYMLHMYQLDAFTQSCPADQDIINHYKLQQVGILVLLRVVAEYVYSSEVQLCISCESIVEQLISLV